MLFSALSCLFLSSFLSLAAAEEEAVYTLTADNFEESVLNEVKQPWLVEFYAPWCGHCQKLEPEWEAAAKELKGRVKLGKVDATVEEELAAKYKIESFPTIKIFYFGAVDPYQGPRQAKEIVEWAEESLDLEVGEKVALELLDQSVFDDNCNVKTCIIAVLPHILDTQAKGRNEMIATLNQVYRRVSRDPWVVMWTHARAHPEFEDAFKIGGTGYPAVAVVNNKNKAYGHMIKAFTSNNLVDFLVSIIKPDHPDKPAIIPFSFEVKLSTVEPWDGEDGEVFEEEEFDLAELGIEVDKDEL